MRRRASTSAAGETAGAADSASAAGETAGAAASTGHGDAHQGRPAAADAGIPAPADSPKRRASLKRPDAAQFRGARPVIAHLKQIGDPAYAGRLRSFFRTGPGEYGEGDRFLGLQVPVLRRLLPRLDGLSLDELAAMLQSPWHEARLLALLALVRRYGRAASREQNDIYRRYLAHTDRINNWDLVDLSAPYIVGAHLADRSRAPLYRLARSPVLWERRIAIVATGYLIRRGEVAETLGLAERLLHDPHDLIHKAVGWMLREAWKRDASVGEFVASHCRVMPRTMLRYAIERQTAEARQRYLRGECGS